MSVINDVKFSFKSRLDNLSRFQTIVRVLVKHGFSGIMAELGLYQRTSSDSSTTTSVAARLRMAFEELGPTFIKLGQLLSTRPDLLSEEYIEEFSKLTDSVPAFDFSEVEAILEEEFGAKLEELFQSIEKEPMAAASIAQVHRAVWRETNTAVVIKVQRPNITRVIQNDIQVLYRLASALERIEDLRLLNPTGIVKEFQRSINEELDFTLEAKNLEYFGKQVEADDRIRVPDVIWPATTKRVLTMTEMKGTPLSQIKEFPPEVDRRKLAEALVSFFFESIFQHGVFHADAHAGNVLLQTEDGGRLVILDFGLVGNLQPELKKKLSKIFLSLVARDFQGLSQTYVEIGDFGRRFSVREFQRDIANFLGPQLGKPLKDINLGQVMLDSTRIARKYQVRVPQDLVLFYRSIMTLESLGRKLDPDFEFVGYGQMFAKTLMRRRFSYDEIWRDVVKTFEGFRTLGTELPVQMQTLVQRLDQGDLFLGGKQADEFKKTFERSMRLHAFGYLSSGFLVSAVLMNAYRPDDRWGLALWGGAMLSIFALLITALQKSKSE